jgi:hypothetical protein
MSLSTHRIVRPLHGPVNEKRVMRVTGALICAASAGVHVALLPAHLHEAPLLGVAFAVDGALLALAAVAVTDTRLAPRATLPTAVLLFTTAVGYLLSRTTGLPLLVREPEPLEGLGLFITVAELAGAACLLAASRREPR